MTVQVQGAPSYSPFGWGKGWGESLRKGVAMSRAIPFACLAAVVISSFAPAQSTIPSLTISIYAPKEKNAPLRITGFQYREGSVGLSIYNQSDGIVTSFAVSALLSAPPGCTSDLSSKGKDSVLNPQIVRTIRPHETATLWKLLEGLPFDPSDLVMGDQTTKYGYLHVQAAIYAVNFSDGRVWNPIQENTDENRAAILDPQLAIRDSPECAHLDIGSILNNLGKVSKVRFSSHLHVSENVTERAGPDPRVPHLVFRCLLQDDSAICPWN